MRERIGAPSYCRRRGWESHHAPSRTFIFTSLLTVKRDSAITVSERVVPKPGRVTAPGFLLRHEACWKGRRRMLRAKSSRWREPATFAHCACVWILPPPRPSAWPRWSRSTFTRSRQKHSMSVWPRWKLWQQITPSCLIVATVFRYPLNPRLKNRRNYNEPNCAPAMVASCKAESSPLGRV